MQVVQDIISRIVAFPKAANPIYQIVITGHSLGATVGDYNWGIKARQRCEYLYLRKTLSRNSGHLQLSSKPNARRPLLGVYLKHHATKVNRSSLTWIRDFIEGLPGTSRLLWPYLKLYFDGSRLMRRSLPQITKVMLDKLSENGLPISPEFY